MVTRRTRGPYASQSSPNPQRCQAHGCRDVPARSPTYMVSNPLADRNRRVDSESAPDQRLAQAHRGSWHLCDRMWKKTYPPSLDVMTSRIVSQLLSLNLPQFLEGLVEGRPDISLRVTRTHSRGCSLPSVKRGVEVSRSTACCTLRRVGFSRKHV